MADDDNSNNVDTNSAAFKSAVDSAVATAIEGVQKTNVDLKSEKTAITEERNSLKASIEAAGGIELLNNLGGAEGLEEVLAFKKRLESDELGQLLVSGKHDEWYERKTEALRQDHQNQVEALSKKVSDSDALISEANGRVRDMALNNEVRQACAEAEVNVSAIEDVQLRAGRDFKYDTDTGQLVIRDAEGGVVFGKDGESPKSVGEWLEEQRESARHWFPASKGSGAGGSETRPPGGKDDMSKLSMTEFKAERNKQKEKTSAY